MDFLSRMNQVVDYIESHLDEDMDYIDLANIACCNVYQFGRIFSYVVGVSLSEYVRRRRLSQAALELQFRDIKVLDVALKYGYNSPDAFTRAFSAMHGITPKAAYAFGVKLRMYPRITFHISIRGDVDMEYRIEKKGIVKCVGVVKNFGKLKVNENADHWTERMGDLWKFWDDFLNRGMNGIIRDKYKLYCPPFYQIGLTETMENGDIVEKIGAELRERKNIQSLLSLTFPRTLGLYLLLKEHSIKKYILLLPQ